MDILTIENNNIKITSLLLTRFITNDNYNNNQALIEIFMGNNNNQDIILNDLKNISLYLNDIQIIADCTILNIFKNNQSNKYNIYIKEK